MVQPLAGKILLPVLGGSPAVWSTCIVFFQAVLLLGYVYAHLVSTRVGRRWQLAIHAGVLLVACVTLPLPVEIGEPGGADPRWWVLRVLAVTAGPPFFALSATAPLLQHWFSRTDHPGAEDPYFLYSASNAGSLIGLTAYLLVEPFATRRGQASAWSAAFWIVAAAVAACGYLGVRRPKLRGGEERSKPSGAGGPSQSPVTRPDSVVSAFRRNSRDSVVSAFRRNSASAQPSRPALWIGLALVPSALLLGVTQHLATDVVSAPLLWVVPLALYLATFMAAFSTRGFGRARRWGAFAAPAALFVLILSLGEVRDPIVPIALVHLAAFTVLAMLCHTRLAETRPAPAHLTGYFVCVSFGGVLGGAAAALAAPAVFSSILEYPLAIGAALLLRPQTTDADRDAVPRGRRWAWRATAALLFVAGYWGVSAFNGSAEMTGRLLRASFAIPAGLLLYTPRAALLFAGTAAGLLVGAGVVRTGGEVL